MEDYNDLVCSEVNSFTMAVSVDGEMVKSKFKFTIPDSLTDQLPTEGAKLLRRSRSNPIGLEDSDEEDIEVPRFNSLDYQNLELEYDSDGDIDVPRLSGTKLELEIVIEHRQHTKLSDVGLQVWRGSLLLSDYLLHHHQLVRDKSVLELGSGTGLSSIVAAFCGAR